MTIDQIIERWAEEYKTLSHNPAKGSKDCAFFRIKSINQENYVTRNHNTVHSPLLCYSIVVDAERQNNVISYQHVLYFMSRAVAQTRTRTAKDDEDLGIDQQQLMDEMVQDLLAWLGEVKRTGKDPITGEQFDTPTMLNMRGLLLDSAHWASNASVVKYGEWHIMGLIIEQNSPFNRCVTLTKYQAPNLQ